MTLYAMEKEYTDVSNFHVINLAIGSTDCFIIMMCAT